MEQSASRLALTVHLRGPLQKEAKDVALPSLHGLRGRGVGWGALKMREQIAGVENAGAITHGYLSEEIPKNRPTSS